MKMKKMMKSQNNRVLTGTLAGIAEYFGIDPTMVRVAFVLSVFFLEGAPIFLYLLLMMVMPKAGSTSHEYRQTYTQTTNSQPKQAETTADDAWSDF
jgi:phage shock protein C